MDLPQGIDSKFRLILLVARRARQIQAGAKPLVQSPYKKATRVALQEVQAGVVPFEVESEPSENGEKSSKAKTQK